MILKIYRLYAQILLIQKQQQPNKTSAPRTDKRHIMLFPNTSLSVLPCLMKLHHVMGKEVGIGHRLSMDRHPSCAENHFVFHWQAITNGTATSSPTSHIEADDTQVPSTLYLMLGVPKPFVSWMIGMSSRPLRTLG